MHNSSNESLINNLFEIFYTHSSVMLMIEPKTKEVYGANKRALKFFNTKNENLLISEFLNLKEQKIEKILKKEKNTFFLKVNIEGNEKKLEITSTAINLNKELLLWVIRDITITKELKKKLKLKKKQLENINRYLTMRVKEEVDKRIKHDNFLIQQSKMALMGEMIGSIAHQWKQPLTALAIMMQNIQIKYELNNNINPNEIETLLHNSNEQIEFMAKTIDDFKNFFNPKKKRKKFNVKKAIEEIISLISNQLNRYSIKVNVEENSFETEGYINEFKQVMLNLINNAKDEIIEKIKVDKSFQGQIDIEIFIKDNRGYIKVRDNAGGVPVNIIDNIFEPYFSDKESGAGIGLYMSKMIIESSIGGQLSVTNVEDGAEFLIELSIS